MEIHFPRDIFIQKYTNHTFKNLFFNNCKIAKSICKSLSLLNVQTAKYTLNMLTAMLLYNPANLQYSRKTIIALENWKLKMFEWKF